ncbi:MAG: hypothetical protein FK732_01575 [Asgard group archaeon]|nr:hypothetical protein [Asgard group archaeon]
MIGFWQSGEVAEAAIIIPYNFYDDFSGDLSQWSSIHGTWAIESGELSQSDSNLWETFSVAGSNEYADYVIETKVKLVSGTETSAGILLRFGDVNNYYTFYINPTMAVLGKRVTGTWTTISGISKAHALDVGYELKVELSQSDFKCYIDNTLVIEATDTTFVQGKIGLRTKLCDALFDDVKVSGAGGAETPSTYEVDIRAGVTQIFVTATWTGSGNITMELVSPTTTYYESDMSIYEKSTASFNGTTTTTSNIKRAGLSVSSLASVEMWICYLDLDNIVTYQVSVEIT